MTTHSWLQHRGLFGCMPSRGNEMFVSTFHEVLLCVWWDLNFLTRQRKRHVAQSLNRAWCSLGRVKGPVELRCRSLDHA
eukprot:2387347-Pleurochrysis_carterae.AAC.3